MRNKDRAFADDLCQQIVERYPNVVAAFEGFDVDYLGGEPDGMLMVEVFRVPSDIRKQLLEFAEDLAYGHFDKGGALICVRTWSMNQSAQLEEQIERVGGIMDAPVEVKQKVTDAQPQVSWQGFGTTTVHCQDVYDKSTQLQHDLAKAA